MANQDRPDTFFTQEPYRSGQKVKVLRLLVSLLLLGLGLSAGMWIGSYFGELIKQREGRPGTSAPTPFTGQKNILVIGVDRIARDARLDALWFVAFIPGNPVITYVPLYPEDRGTLSESAQSLLDTFAIDRDDSIPFEFFGILTERYAIPWDGYVLLDSVALMRFVDLVGGLDLGEGKVSGPVAVGGIPLPRENLREALDGQAILLTKLCHHLNDPDIRQHIESIQELIPRHLQTDLDIELALQDWLELTAGSEPIRCKILHLEDH